MMGQRVAGKPSRPPNRVQAMAGEKQENGGYTQCCSSARGKYETSLFCAISHNIFSLKFSVLSAQSERQSERRKSERLAEQDEAEAEAASGTCCS